MKTMKTKGYKKGGAMKTKGYAKGGALKMVEKDGKKVPFYAADGKGKMAEGGEVKPLKGMGNMPLDDEQAAEAIENLKKQKEAKKKDDGKKTPPVKKKGGGMMKTKGYKKGGAMKTKGYSKGGKVRGAGVAKRGVRPCKMR